MNWCYATEDPAGEVVVLSTINMIRSLFGSAAAGERRRAGLGRRFWPAFAIAAVLLGQSSFSARADIEDSNRRVDRLWDHA